jgi:transposase
VGWLASYWFSVLGNVPVASSSSPELDVLRLVLLGLCERQHQEIASMRGTIGRLGEERAALQEANRGLVIECDQLKQRNEELSRRLGLDSTNSSKPPSSDGLKRTRRTARSPERERRKWLGRKPGKQKGAPGHHLAQTARPDRVVELLPAHCGHCGRWLVENSGEVGMEKRQVMDLPPPPGLETTEYRAIKLRCVDCGQVTKATFPEWAKGPVQYGPRLHAMANYLAVRQHTPYERMAEQIHDIYGADVSVGALAAMVARGGRRVQPAVEAIKRQLQAAAVAHLDETGAHVNGKLRWVHGTATKHLTLLGIDDHRGTEGIKALGVMEEFTGVAIHDAWSSYWGAALEKVRGHGLCNAHHLRELVAVTELDGQRWSRRMTNLLLEMLAMRNAAMEADRSQLQPELVAEFERRYDRVIGEGWRENPRRPGKQQLSKAANLLRRLDEHRTEVLRFILDFAVPFTNNEIERDLRMTKLHEKISGGWRSMDGARAFLSVRSYLATARKQGQGMLEVLTAAFEGRPWLPAAAGP